MAKIRLTTISPIHVGSGVKYQNNLDFVIEKENGRNMAGIIDEKKVAELIGLEHIDEWVQYIERGKSTVDLIKKYAGSATLRDFTSRTMPIYAAANNDDTLKEFIHDGMGHAYIPGSSIKGAIRSAILELLVQEEKDLEQSIVKKNKDKLEVSASKVEKKIFGNDPNKDIFRFIKVGDAIFENGVEEAIRLVMYLNITEKDSLIPVKDRKPQIVEVIRSGAEAEFNLTVDTRYNIWASEKTKFDKDKLIKSFPEAIEGIHKVFTSVNKHTGKLVDDEIEYWTNVSEELSGAEKYIKELETIQSKFDTLSANECILRLGHASGWDFITGGWARELNNFDKDVVPASRPGNNFKYKNYDFPKSRRLDENSQLLGFVKLSIE